MRVREHSLAIFAKKFAKKRRKNEVQSLSGSDLGGDAIISSVEEC